MRYKLTSAMCSTSTHPGQPLHLLVGKSATKSYSRLRDEERRSSRGTRRIHRSERIQKQSKGRMTTMCNNISFEETRYHMVQVQYHDMHRDSSGLSVDRGMPELGAKYVVLCMRLSEGSPGASQGARPHDTHMTYGACIKSKQRHGKPGPRCHCALGSRI